MSGRTLLRVGALLGTTLVLTACSPPREERDPLLATFAGGEVRQSDLDTWRSFLNAQGRDGHWLGLDALERHVVMRTLAGEAIDAGLDEEPAVRIRVRRAVDERLAVLLRADVARSIEIPADLVEGYLEEHRDELDKPERRTVRFIFRRSSEDDPDRARLELQEARRRLLAGEDFAAVAAEVSESPSRLRGGLLGTIPRGKLPEQVDRILFSLEEGKVSDVVRTGAGFALLRCDRIFPAHTMESEEARHRVEQYFRKPRVDAAWNALVDELTGGRVDHDLGVLLDPAAGPDQVVGTFGEEALTKAEAEALLRPLGDDTSEDEAFAGRAATLLDRFAVNALLAAEARRRGLDERPEKRRELEWVREEQLSKETLRWKVDPMMTEPDEEAIRGYYESHLDNYREPERYGLRVLQRPGSPEAIADGYRELANVRAAVRDGEPMIDTDGRVVARVWYSRSQVAGWGLTVLRSVDRLRPGEVTEPIQQGDALWLIQLVEREPGQLRDLSAVRGKVARAIEREERWRLDYQLLQRTLEAAALERPSEVGRTQQRGKD